MKNEKKVAYGVVILGTLLAAASSIVPHYGAGHRLAFGLLLWGMVPYYACLLLSGVAAGRRLLLPGALMIIVDIVAKGYQVFHRGSAVAEGLALYIPLVLLIALAGGYVIGAKRDQQAGEG